MKHLLSFSVFQNLAEIAGDDPAGFLEGIGCDGLELFTLFEDVPPGYGGYAAAVHLPYAIDWHRAWTGRVTPERYSPGDLDYITFGTDREEMVRNIRKGIDKAAALSPAYGVIHAGNTNLAHVMRRNHPSDDRKILEAFAEMMNMTVSEYPGGEPPFKLAFENLFWEGLKLREPWEHSLLAHKLEFDGWGFCLDVGHLMSTLPDAEDEASATDGVLRVIDGYSRDMKDRIGTMHFHWSATAEYRRTFVEKETDPDSEFYGDIIERTYGHVDLIDRHNAFTDPRCVEIAEAIMPDYITHELVRGDTVREFMRQRSFFG